MGYPTGESNAAAGRVAGDSQDLTVARHRFDTFLADQAGLLTGLKSAYQNYRIANQSQGFGAAMDNVFTELGQCEAKLRETALELAQELGTTAAAIGGFSEQSVTQLHRNVTVPGYEL